MFYKAGVLLAFLALHVLARPELYSRQGQAVVRCGTGSPVGDVAEAEIPSSEEDSADPSQITIDTFIHVIESPGFATLTQQQAVAQIAVLNADFAKYNIDFSYKGIFRYDNELWASDGFQFASEYKTATRKGSYRTLNIWAHPNMAYLGFAEFPKKIKAGTAISDDGVVCLTSTFPGGGLAPYDLGKTATHEVGHWLGLFHVFEGASCDGRGDKVSDTPFQSSPTFGCPVGKDSCPDAPGRDSVQNYMDYSDDACMTEFTRKQGLRMRKLWKRFREGE